MNKSKQLGRWMFILLITGVGFAGAQTTVVLDDFESQSVSRWHQWASQAAFEPIFYDIETTDADAHSGSYCGAISFDTVETDARAFLLSRFPESRDSDLPDDSTDLQFWTKTEKTIRFQVYLIDATGQTHYRGFTQNPGIWEQKSYSLLSPWASHSGGANDGVIHQPAQYFQFHCYSDESPVSGNIYIDDIEVFTSVAEQDSRDDYWRNGLVYFDCNNVPGNLFHFDSVNGRVTVSRPPFDDIALEITGNVYDANDELVFAIAPVELNCANHWGADVDIPDELGYYRINLIATDTSDPGNTTTRESRYGVIVPNAAMDEKELDSPFGVNTHWSFSWQTPVGEIVKRSGIAWARDYDNGATIAALYTCKRNKLCYMVILNSLAGNGLPAMFADTLASDPDFPRSGAGSWDYTCAWNNPNPLNSWFDPCADILARQSDYAAQYGDDVDAYNLWNEPTNGYDWDDPLGGDWSGGAWTETFADYGKQLAAAIRSQDPTAPIVWDDMDSLLWYEEFYDYGAADSIDVMSPHPYSAAHMDENPEKQPVMLKQDEWFDFLSDNDLDWEVWSGEVGDTTSGVPGWHRVVTELEQARLLVRMMSVQLEWGVDKIFYYDFMNDGIDPNEIQHNFGLIRADYLPKPAVVAYSHLIHRLKGYEVLDRYLIGDSNAYIYRVLDRSGEAFLIVSALNGLELEIDIPVYTDVTEVSVTDIFGADQGAISVVDGNLQITATESPVYIDGLKAWDLGLGNIIPYAEPFESYSPGYPMPGMYGWSATNLDAAVVSTNSTMIAALTDTYTGGFPIDTAHTKVLRTVSPVTNAVDSAAASIVKFDGILSMKLGIPELLPELPSGEQTALWIDSDGCVNILHADTDNGSDFTTEWLVLTNGPAISSDEWMRVTVLLNYTDKMFQLRLNDGLPLSDSKGWTAAGGTQPGTWFYMADRTLSSLSHVSLSGETWLDDLVLTESVLPPAQASAPSPGEGATGVSIDADVSWTAGSGATARNVYGGTNVLLTASDLLTNGIAATTYDPGTLAYNTTYYWRIDELNAGGITEGAVWSFTTAPQMFALTLSAGSGGNVSPESGSYASGQTVGVTALPSTYYHFTQWSGDTGAITDGTADDAAVTVTMNSAVSLSAAFAADETLDGTPHEWMADAHPDWTNDFETVAADDFDEDGLTTGQEYVSGTDATNAVSVFAGSIATVAGDAVISLPTVSSDISGKVRRYGIKTTTNLMNDSWGWVPGCSNILGQGQPVIYTNTADGPVFIRGHVWLE